MLHKVGHVLCKVARARGGVVLSPGITVIGAPGATAAAVMPGVRRTLGLPCGREARGVKPWMYGRLAVENRYPAQQAVRSSLPQGRDRPV